METTKAGWRWAKVVGGFVLPPLSGAIGKLARAGYVALAVITAIIVAGSLVFNGLDAFRNLPADAKWGFRTFSAVDPGKPPYIGDVNAAAAARGLRLDDVPIAINGQALPAGTTEYGIGKRSSAAKGDSLTMTVERSDHSRSTVTLPQVRHPWLTLDRISGLPLWVSSLGSFLSLEAIPVFLLAASLLLMIRRPRDPEAMLFAIGFLLLCNIGPADFWLLAFLDVPVQWISAVQSLGQCIVIIAAAGFPQGKFDDRWSRAVLFLALPVGMFSYWIRHQAKNPTQGSFVAAALLLSLTLVAMVGIGRRYRRLEVGAARQQVKWVVFGFCVSAVSTVIYLRLIDYNLYGNITYYVFFQLLQLVAFVSLPLGLVVSLLRYRLYDAERAISRSAVYAVLTCSLLLIFAITEKLIEMSGPELFGGDAGAVGGAIAAGVAAVLIAPLHHRIEQWAKARFQRELVRLREGFPLLAGDLREVAGLEDLAAALLKRIDEGVPAAWLAIVLDHKTFATRNVEPLTVSTWLAASEGGETEVQRIDRDDSLFPLRQALTDHTETQVGWLLLGPRPDESFYSSEELAILDEVAGHLTRALLICRQREAFDRNVDGRIGVIVQRVDAIEKQLSRGI